MEGVTTPSMAQGATSNSSVFSPLIISMLGIVVTTMAIMAYHLLLVKYCIRRYAASAAAAQSNAGAPPPPTGVDEKVLQTIPIFAFAVVKRDGTVDQAECVVCLGELEEEDAVRLLPNCNHAFHVSCIDQWFAAHASCPMCRSPVLRQETDAAPVSPDLLTAEDPNLGGISSENCATDGSGEPPPPPIGLLRHCASMVTPPPAEMERGSWSRLKRSVSMDQWVVVIDLQRGNCSNATPFPSSGRGILQRSGSFSTPSLSHFDRVPSKWLRSFSWLRTGKGSNGAILPC